NVWVTLRQTLLKQTSGVALEEIKLKFIDTSSNGGHGRFQTSEEKAKFYETIKSNKRLSQSQISVYSASGVLWLSISSLILVLRSSSTSVPVAGLLVLGLGSSNGLITALLWVSLSPVAVTLVNLVVASCTGCSALITTSCFIHLPTIQVVFLRFSNLFTGVVLIVLECSPGLSLTLVQPFSASYVCWVLFVDIYCPLSSSMKCVSIPISSSTLSGFVSGIKTFKIRDTSDIEHRLIKMMFNRLCVCSHFKDCQLCTCCCFNLRNYITECAWLLRLNDLSTPLVDDFVIMFCKHFYLNGK
ncbi:LOW QUALITY PROTEIN: hypothetical protein HID58_085919, partial [Brassica napus]